KRHATGGRFRATRGMDAERDPWRQDGAAGRKAEPSALRGPQQEQTNPSAFLISVTSLSSVARYILHDPLLPDQHRDKITCGTGTLSYVDQNNKKIAKKG
ncbi:MAG: hypothetical protein LBT22_00725, partial [Peptococcaceae bacterium]|nr:hypothetical protein [Peptococcaceae bacterium]